MTSLKQLLRHKRRGVFEITSVVILAALLAVSYMLLTNTGVVALGENLLKNPATVSAIVMLFSISIIAREIASHTGVATSMYFIGLLALTVGLGYFGLSWIMIVLGVFVAIAEFMGVL